MKSLTFKQRLALAVYSSPKDCAYSTPYGFEAYAKAAAKCNNRRLTYHW
jgi:hypothetical protein